MVINSLDSRDTIINYYTLQPHIDANQCENWGHPIVPLSLPEIVGIRLGHLAPFTFWFWWYFRQFFTPTGE